MRHLNKSKLQLPIGSKTDMLKLTVLFVCCYQVWSHPDQHRLYNDLMSSYNPLFIPMLNNSDVQRVVMDARLHKIIDVDEAEGVLTTLIWLDLSWDDDYLRKV